MRRVLARTLTSVSLAAGLGVPSLAVAQTDPLASWNDGAAKRALVEFVRATTTQGGASFVPAAERIAMFRVFAFDKSVAKR